VFGVRGIVRKYDNTDARFYFISFEIWGEKGNCDNRHHYYITHSRSPPLRPHRSLRLTCSHPPFRPPLGRHEALSKLSLFVARALSLSLSSLSINFSLSLSLVSLSLRWLAPATVTCSYIVRLARWTLGWGNLVHDTATTMPGPCSQKSASPRGEGALRRHRRSAVGNTWAVWGSIPVVFPPGMSGHPCLIIRVTSLSLRGEPANTGKG
jgi:hypothetical protein